MICITRGTPVLKRKAYDRGYRSFLTEDDIFFSDTDIVREYEDIIVLEKKGNVYYLEKNSCIRQAGSL